MEERTTDWESLGLSNDFLFGKVMQDAGLCGELLQRILPDLEIGRIEYPELQKEVKPDSDAKSIRLDVYVKDKEDVIYNIEMQTSDTREIPKRSRYYQGMIDLQLLDKGDKSYAKLNRSYIIFICPFDLFGRGRHIYTFENICLEDPGIILGDESIKIFLNANGTMDDVSQELKIFLDFINGKKTDDPFIKELEKALEAAKKNRKWRHEYMTLLMRDRENLEKGMEQGMEKGMEQGMEKGMEQGIRSMVAVLKELGVPTQTIRAKIQEQFDLSPEKSGKYL